MVDAVLFLPAVVALVACLAWGFDKTEGRGERTVARVARVAFGPFVSSNSDRERLVEAAYLDTTYRTYAAKTYLFTVLGLLGGTAAGGYAFLAVLSVLEPLARKMAQLPSAISSTLGLTPDFELVLSETLTKLIVVGGGLVVGVVVAAGAYYFRWKLPESDTEVRRRGIEEGLPRTVAFTYALSRGGMPVPEVFRTLGDNSEVYGEAAKEMRVATREMDLFGRDVITAIRRMARRTPSDRFKTYAENLASVFQSGSSLPAFLREQYDRFQEEAEERQEDLLELLATIAEGYVTVLVAGTLFLITILLVFGLTTTDTLWLLQSLAYLLVPLANVGFGVYLIQKLETLGIGQRAAGAVVDRYDTPTPVNPSPDVEAHQTDGGLARDRSTAVQLRWYDRLRRLKRLVGRPLRTVLRNPTAVLYLTVPVALLAFVLRAPAAFRATGVNVRILDDLVVQSVLLVLIPYAVVRYVYKRRIDAIEAATPDLLERLASLNEAGMTVVEGVDRVRSSDLGVLNDDVERIWRDVQYGSTVADALIRFGRRVRTRSITRVVVLLSHASRASGELGDVLRIAADQARADVRMRRSRRRQMLTYLVVIYISFAVFLVIILAVQHVLVPSLPQSVPTPDPERANRLGVNVDQFARIGQVDKAAYTLVFFHTALIQAVCSGFVGGLLGEGTLRDGAKHAAILLGIAYLAFVLLSAPVASITAGGQAAGSDELTLDTVSLSDGGYVVVHERGINSTTLGTSDHLAPGTHHDVNVTLSRSLRDGESVYIVPHRETNGNRAFDYPGPPWIPSASVPDRPYSPLSNDATPGIEVGVSS